MNSFNFNAPVERRFLDESCADGFVVLYIAVTIGVRAKTCAQVLGTMANESARYFTGARKILRNQCTRGLQP